MPFQTLIGFAFWNFFSTLFVGGTTRIFPFKCERQKEFLVKNLPKIHIKQQKFLLNPYTEKLAFLILKKLILAINM